MNENIGQIFSASKVFDWDAWLIDSDRIIAELCDKLFIQIPSDLSIDLVSKYTLEIIRPMGYPYKIIVYKDLPMLVIWCLDLYTETVNVIIKFVTRKKEDGIDTE